MKSIQLFLILGMLMICAPGAFAKLNVVTTVPDLRSIVNEVGQDEVNVSSIAKGTQDPHFIEAKPSYMTKISQADLVVAIGMELEIGYLPPLLNGARNPKVMPGSPGYLEVGPLVEPLEVPAGKISRSDGDVHPEGNPHVTLDPIRAGEIAVKIAGRLGQLDSAHAAVFLGRAQTLQKRLVERTKGWSARVAQSKVKEVITYHRTLTYFLSRFGIGNPAILEPKPGIPPTGGHTLEVIALVKEKKIPLILVENYFDPTVTNKIKTEVPAVRAATVPVSVDGAPGMNTLDDVYEKLVSTVEGK